MVPSWRALVLFLLCVILHYMLLVYRIFNKTFERNMSHSNHEWTSDDHFFRMNTGHRAGQAKAEGLNDRDFHHGARELQYCLTKSACWQQRL